MRYLELPTRKRYSVIGLGTWQFGSREWGYGREYDEHAAGEIVARARALGITVFDTAEIYGFGRSERILGRALREAGGTDEVVVATTLFPVLPTAPVVQQRAVASAHRLGVRTLEDRKSTRLNSSHQIISYAVFCLKKKKKKKKIKSEQKTKKKQNHTN